MDTLGDSRNIVLDGDWGSPSPTARKGEFNAVFAKLFRPLVMYSFTELYVGSHSVSRQLIALMGDEWTVLINRNCQ